MTMLLLSLALAAMMGVGLKVSTLDELGAGGETATNQNGTPVNCCPAQVGTTAKSCDYARSTDLSRPLVFDVATGGTFTVNSTTFILLP